MLEGVAFAFRDSLEALRAAGTKLSRVTAIGGGSRSRLLAEVDRHRPRHPGRPAGRRRFRRGLRAARLGLIAAENADPLAVCTAPATAETIEPDGALGDAYSQAYQRYRELYPAIKGGQQT